MSFLGEPIEEPQRGIGRLAPPQRDDVVLVERHLRFERRAHVDDLLSLHLQHRAHVDGAEIGDDQFEQQLAAQVARVGNWCRQPLAELRPAGPGSR